MHPHNLFVAGFNVVRHWDGPVRQLAVGLIAVLWLSIVALMATRSPYRQPLWWLLLLRNSRHV